jgi:hypothetical protein
MTKEVSTALDQFVHQDQGEGIELGQFGLYCCPAARNRISPGGEQS